jgi:CRP-like cAMP-binding protein
MKVDVATLAAHPFLNGMSAEHLALLASKSTVAQYGPGKRILHEGGSTSGFYLIVSGRVDLETPLLNGDSVAIEPLGPGEAFGWSWFFGPCHCQLDARVVEATKLILLQATSLHLRDLCEQDHDLGYELMKRFSEVVAQRLHATHTKLVEYINNMTPRDCRCSEMFDVSDDSLQKVMKIRRFLF